jgi:hypothetical protein
MYIVLILEAEEESVNIVVEGLEKIVAHKKY